MPIKAQDGDSYRPIFKRRAQESLALDELLGKVFHFIDVSARGLVEQGTSCLWRNGCLLGLRMSNELPQAAPALLYAEDSEDDFFFFDRAARSSQIPLSIIWVRDGFEAQHFLSKPNYRLPAALITDLRMPGCNGYELLTWLKGHPFLRNLPVYVLSTSKLDSDKELCRTLGAKKYFEKPSSSKEYAKLLQEIVGELNLTGLHDPLLDG